MSGLEKVVTGMIFDSAKLAEDFVRKETTADFWRIEPCCPDMDTGEARYMLTAYYLIDK